MNAGGMLNTC
ncbi:hypothetical protein CLOM_g13612, partial [Closterium sp. NIES-68]